MFPMLCVNYGVPESHIWSYDLLPGELFPITAHSLPGKKSHLEDMTFWQNTISVFVLGDMWQNVPTRLRTLWHCNLSTNVTQTFVHNCHIWRYYIVAWQIWNISHTLMQSKHHNTQLLHSGTCILIQAMYNSCQNALSGHIVWGYYPVSKCLQSLRRTSQAN